MEENNLEKLEKKFIRKLDEFIINSQELDEEEPMTEAEIIYEISMLTKEIIRHKVELRDLQNKVYKLEELLKIK